MRVKTRNRWTWLCGIAAAAASSWAIGVALAWPKWAQLGPTEVLAVMNTTDGSVRNLVFEFTERGPSSVRALSQRTSIELLPSGTARRVQMPVGNWETRCASWEVDGGVRSEVLPARWAADHLAYLTITVTGMKCEPVARSYLDEREVWVLWVPLLAASLTAISLLAVLVGVRRTE
jgi:hypothetical protein